jgi:hypothetical protein
MRLLGRALVTAIVAAGAFVVVGCGGFVATLHSPPAAHLAVHYHLPHHVPKYPAGLSFRFAMAHDVVHERYPKHGPAYFRERERLAREKLARLDPNCTDALAANDDLAVAFYRQGRADEAVVLMRDKLARQRRLKIEGKALYTTNANLGTLLQEANFAQAAAGDSGAKARFREGTELVRRAMAVNPEAHFGREQWQAALGEFLLAAMDDPGLLTKFDFVGDRLDTRAPELLIHEHNLRTTGYGRAYTPDMPDSARFEVPALFQDGVAPDDAAHWAELNPMRRFVQRVGAEDGWKTIQVPSHREPVPFDEPALGIVGMWRQVGGANPHLALALGEVMLRVGQRYIAWTAFERAARLADEFWPQPTTREALLHHCRVRQQETEWNLLHVGDDPVPAATVTRLRTKFDAELAYGEQFQREYQEYEAARIAAGASIDDDHFYDEFNAGRAPIASPTGPEERYSVIRASRLYDSSFRAGLHWGILAAGAAALAAALLFRLSDKRGMT